ncbi:hypothetical protein AAF712_004827 [Marasmius tenuissimus]|uniref:Uncharacterized protein n=1 Tax=Marasmius tenuissimus TaxID=585030 RepID=A0ABR3A459_9AGAR
MNMKQHSTSLQVDNDKVRSNIEQACAAIFSTGYSVNNENYVQVHLESTSILPIQGTFSEVLQPHGLNHYDMFVPDSFHDLMGRISDLLKHNVRILATKKKCHIEYLDACLRKGDHEAHRKTFSLVNYKTHALGHKADAIVKYGTTNGTSTQAGEREHKQVKDKYQVTDKNKPEGQIAALITVEHKTSRAVLRRAKLKPIPPPDPSLHHQLPQNQNNPMEFHLVLNPKNPYDAPLKGFKSKLQRHLIARICNMDPDLVFDNKLYQLSFVGGRFYRHQRFRLHYTSYDCRRKKELIGFRRRPHIMMLTGDLSDPHPYLYARVIGIYHANVLYLGEDPTYRRTRRMEFLFVRWLQFNESHQWGWKAKSTPQVIRASHMIPAFEQNTTPDLLPSNSIVRVYEEYHENAYTIKDEDWRYYYVNIFPDTDMFMRYRGGGIGHVEFHEFLRRLEEEATENDIPLPEYDENGDVVRAEEMVEDNMDEDEEDNDGEEETLEGMFIRVMAGWDEDSDDDCDKDRDSDGEDSGSDNK